jgi:hypothetical protein
MRIGRKAVLGGPIAALVVFLAAWPAQAAGISEFKLAGAIPADAAIAVYARNHPGKEFINEQMQRVWKTVEAQHFEKDLRTLLKGLYESNTEGLTEAERQQRTEQFDAQWQHFDELLQRVDWSGLFKREAAFGLKLTFPAPEFVLLGMGPPDETASNFAGLEAILEALVSFAPEGALVTSKQGEGESAVYTIAPGPDMPIPLSLVLARQKDVLLLGLGTTMPEQSLALLRGEPGQSLSSTERFQSAMKRLPPPVDSAMFFDISRYFGQLRAYIDSAVAMSGPAAEEMDPKLKALPGKIIDAIDICDYVAKVSDTEGMKKTSESILVLLPDAQSKPLYPVIFGNGVLTEPLKFIPQSAEGFNVWEGINLKALYDGIINFVRDNVPNGPELLEEWETTKTTLPFDIENDVLSWIGGTLQSFSTPAETAYRPGAWFMATNVTDEAKGQEALTRFFNWLEPKLKEQNGALRDADVEGATGFKTVVMPMLMIMGPLGQPTIGIAQGQLIVASGPKVISLALATATGESPNFSTNERFRQECPPMPSKDVYAASYTDLTKLGEQLGQALKMIPMVGIAAPQIAQQPLGRAMLSAANKLGNVVQQINFLQSSCSASTFDGKVVKTKAVVNYRQPPPPQTQSAPAPEEESPTTAPSGGSQP